MTTFAQRKKQKRLSPRNAEALRQICQLRTSAIYSKWGWMNVDVEWISIYEQRIGEKATQEIRIRRREFNRMVEWYLKEQKCRP